MIIKTKLLKKIAELPNNCQPTTHTNHNTGITPSQIHNNSIVQTNFIILKNQAG